MDDATRTQLLDIFDRAQTIAVVGASADESKPAHKIPAYLQQMGYRIIPVSPRGGELFGEKVYASLADITEHVDVVDVFRPPAESVSVAEAAAATDADVLWFQPGTDTGEAVRIARQAGKTVISGRCMGATHAELGVEPKPSPA